MRKQSGKISINLVLALLCSLSTNAAQAQLTAVVAVEPTSRTESHAISRSAIENGLGQVTGQVVAVTTSDDLAGVMRATRSAGFSIFIGPAQVAASALMRGYELVGSTGTSSKYVLVARNDVTNLPSMKDRRLYLPQQDSIYTYMARGMLNQAGLSFKDLRTVQYQKYPEAGLPALLLGSSDATVVSESAWDEWSKQHEGVAKVLATSQPVPAGLSVVVSRDLPKDQRAAVAKWFTSPTAGSGLAPVSTRADSSEYFRVAELGLFTPASLPKVQVVDANEVQKLQTSGAVLVDTRTEKEFKTKHIGGAVHAAYVEKSLKDVAFDASLDDFTALNNLQGLNKDKPVIFACNGAECWKSYKAAKVASANGFKSVYWFRGGLPEWVAKGLPTQGA